MSAVWDLVVIGAGPAGSGAALGALDADPALSVLVLDRADFPRDKACGDGIAPQALDVLADVGVTGLLDGWEPVRQLQLTRGNRTVERTMSRPAFVVPRTVFDARLVERATAAGAVLTRHRVRVLGRDEKYVLLDGRIRAKVVVGADGAQSMVRRTLGLPQARHTAIAIRGYAPVPPRRRGQQSMAFGRHHQPSYAWSFDRGDGLSNVGYGELLRSNRPAPTRQWLLDQLAELLPCSTTSGTDWRGHHLPLSSWTWQQPDGRCLLAGDAANLVNPMTGEGIYYALATGVLAGRAAAQAIEDGSGTGAGARHRRAVRSLLASHLRHTALASRLVAQPAVLGVGLRAAARDQQVFDDLVELGLGRGRITPRLLGGLAAGLPRTPPHAARSGG